VLFRSASSPEDTIMAPHTIDKPVRVSVFDTIAQADHAVRDLRAAGFTHDELSVICTDRHKAALFHDVQTPAPAGTNAPAGILAGSAVGAAIGGLGMAASALVTGGASLLIGGAAMIAGGALVGTFAGAMMTRGLEPEMVNYYDQAVQHGKILVAVEVTGEDSGARLELAERILNQDGPGSVPLDEG